MVLLADTLERISPLMLHRGGHHHIAGSTLRTVNINVCFGEFVVHRHGEVRRRNVILGYEITVAGDRDGYMDIRLLVRMPLCDNLKSAWVTQVLIHGAFQLLNLIAHIVVVFLELPKLLERNLEQLLDAKA